MTASCTPQRDCFHDTGLINPGIHALALACEADDPDLDENLLVMSETGVQAAAVAGSAQRDLAMHDIAGLILL